MRPWKSLAIAATLLFVGSVILRTVRAQNYPYIDQAKVLYLEPQSLNYFWDQRTQLCFASATFSGAYGAKVTVFTNVPCTDKVWAVINRR